MKKILLSMFLLGTLLSAYAQVPIYVPSNGLVGWWPFTGNAIDSSGSGNNGTVNGASLTTDRYGRSNQAYSFSDNTISVAHNSNLGFPKNGQQTISVWLYVTGTQKVQHPLGKRPNGAQQFNWQVSWNAPASQGVTYTGNVSFTNTGVASTYYPSINTWEYYTFVYNSGKWIIYLNGNQLATTNANLYYQDVNCPLTFGNAGTFQPYYGKLDDIGIWNRALDSKEIKLLFKGCDRKITQQPINISTSNKKVSFTCQANDTLQTYQWQILENSNWLKLKDTAQFSGTKTSKLSVERLLSKNNGQKFRCLVKGNCINAISEVATLTYNCNDSITNQPTNQVMFSGNATFTCATNDTLLKYQWQSDLGMGWNNLSNAGQYTGSNTNSLLVSNVTVSNNNQFFRCVIKGDCMKDTTTEATLNIWSLEVEDEIISKLKVYPNPNCTQLIIDNGNYSTMGSYTAKIVNASGQQVFQSIINQQQFVIDAKTMGGAGVYTLYITDANNKVVGVKKIVLQ